jgi:hypothetical protein
MKKLLVILLLLQTSYIGFAQTDSLKKVQPKYKFGVSVGCNINLHHQQFISTGLGYPASPYYNNFSKSSLYKNSFFTTLLTPSCELSYCSTKRIIHSLSFGIVYQKRENNYDSEYGSNGVFRNLFLNYQFNYIVLNNKKITPIIGINFFYSNKKVMDTIPSDLGGIGGIVAEHVKHYTLDYSDLFLIQTPIGFSIGRKPVLLSIIAYVNLVGYVAGHQKYRNYGSITYINPSYYTETIDNTVINTYSKVLFGNDFIRNRFLFANLQFNFSYFFNIKPCKK